MQIKSVISGTDAENVRQFPGNLKAFCGNPDVVTAVSLIVLAALMLAAYASSIAVAFDAMVQEAAKLLH